MKDENRNDLLQATSFLHGTNAAYVESLHSKYSRNPNAVEATWKRYFDALGREANREIRSYPGPSWARNDWPQAPADDTTAAFDGNWTDAADEPSAAMLDLKIRGKAAEGGVGLSEDDVRDKVLDSIRALMLIRAYRIRGHRIAKLDPLGMMHHVAHPELDVATYGFGEADMDRPIFIDNVLGLEIATLRQILELVKRTYCGTLALQYMHISDPEQASWLKERIEGYGKEIQFTQEGRRAILYKLVEAEGLEKFFHVKYTGTKRFGLDGAEALIPAMEQIIKRGGALGVREIIIGMPHRGRLNVLANVMGKPYRAILNEFQGGSSLPEDVSSSGDVKYHLGASSDREFDGNKVHLSLTANPSHLEAVNPVVLGKARAKQDQMGDVEHKRVLPVLLHGDAAFAGQGIVAECFGLSGLVGHKTGGTIHIVVNNQIGFTTTPHHSRSSPYPTDIGMMTEAPIFHVNGDDPEAVVHAAKVATEFRQNFGKDVVIDIFCYRRFGHNEGDEPMFTQPKMYSIIKKHKSTLQIYSDRLVEEGLVPEGDIEDMKTELQIKLNEEFEVAKSYMPNEADWLDGRWSHLKPTNPEIDIRDTGVAESQIKQIGKALVSVPSKFNIHKTLARLLEGRKKRFESGKNFDWSDAEAMAFATLLLEGYPVRLSGQDSVRGTFSQRHSAIIDQVTEERYFPLNNIDKDQAKIEVIDSMLSEFAVLGFEYGYSLAEPNALVLWEAQFGDFANGAQIMFDQFISPGEKKWLRMSGLTVLLPHGFEGQGPEHSSARLERFLQMSADDNWRVANCTTPANYFHILRSQLHRDDRKPLILMTPKSLLRHKLAISHIGEFLPGSRFHRVLWDDAELGRSEIQLVPDEKIKRVVLTSGKAYYDLFQEREERGVDDIYIMRFEQYYPFPYLSARTEFSRFKNAEFIWCQEEPKNQGAWTFMEPNILWVLNKIRRKKPSLEYVGRPAAASPATGLASDHRREQAKLVDEALTLKEDG